MSSTLPETSACSGAVPPRERLIVALDVEDRASALRLVDGLGEAVSFYKVGYELFVAEGMALVAELGERGRGVFLDLKINDVPETVTRAVRRVAAQPGIRLLTVYGEAATVSAACAGKGASSLRILQVTLLTSLSSADLESMMLVGPGRRFPRLEDYVVWRARTAVDHGADGVITSGQNAGLLREALGAGPLIVCPGIRPAGVSTDDHKRPATPFETIRDGADYLVVGRPIRDAADPAGQAEAIVADIGKGLEARAGQERG